MTREFRRTGVPQDATFTTWWNQAICRKFPQQLADPLWNTASPWRNAGRMLCQVCPVRNWCLASALTDHLWGDQALRGGLTYRERATLKQDIQRAGLHIFDSGLSQEAQATILKDWINDRRIDAARLETSAMWRNYKRNNPPKRAPAYRQADFSQLMQESTPEQERSGEEGTGNERSTDDRASGRDRSNHTRSTRLEEKRTGGDSHDPTTHRP